MKNESGNAVRGFGHSTNVSGNHNSPGHGTNAPENSTEGLGNNMKDLETVLKGFGECIKGDPTLYKRLWKRYIQDLHLW